MWETDLILTKLLFQVIQVIASNCKAGSTSYSVGILSLSHIVSAFGLVFDK